MDSPCQDGLSIMSSGLALQCNQSMDKGKDAGRALLRDSYWKGTADSAQMIQGSG